MHSPGLVITGRPSCTIWHLPSKGTLPPTSGKVCTHSTWSGQEDSSAAKGKLTAGWSHNRPGPRLLAGQPPSLGSPPRTAQCPRRTAAFPCGGLAVAAGGHISAGAPALLAHDCNSGLGSKPPQGEGAARRAVRQTMPGLLLPVGRVLGGQQVTDCWTVVTEPEPVGRGRTWEPGYA